jgi:nitrogen regulatory protein PII
MNGFMSKLVTVITESALERVLIEDIKRLGARGFTITDARGEGRRGPRRAEWDESRSIRIEIVCDPATARTIADHLQANYFEDYGMILFLADVTVMRPEKFRDR